MAFIGTWILIGIAMIPLLPGMLQLGEELVQDWRAESTFSQASWFEANDQSYMAEATRTKMADDLIERELLIGMTVAEVLEMLGQPESVNRLERSLNEASEAPSEFWYYLNPGLVDPKYLVIEFDAQGRVRRAYTQVT